MYVLGTHATSVSAPVCHLGGTVRQVDMLRYETKRIQLNILLARLTARANSSK